MFMHELALAGSEVRIKIFVNEEIRSNFVSFAIFYRKLCDGENGAWVEIFVANCRVLFVVSSDTIIHNINS